MAHVRASDLADAAVAILRADLMTCRACTLEGLRVTAVAALEAVYPSPQTVVVRRDDPDGDAVTIRIEGPHLRGTIRLIAPGCD